MLWEMFTHASIVGKLGVVVALFPVVIAVAYAIKPTERRLALMRPLSLAAIFGGLASLTVGFASVLQGIAATSAFGTATWRHIAMGAAESILGLFVACGCLTIAWLLVALGLRRTTYS